MIGWSHGGVWLSSKSLFISSIIVTCDEVKPSRMTGIKISLHRADELADWISIQMLAVTVVTPDENVE